MAVILTDRMSTARTDHPTPPGGSADNGNGASGTPASGGDDENVLRFVIPSDLDRGREVQVQILRACREAGFNDDAYFAIKLALDEAVTNAIKHGNKLNADKQVKVVATVTPDLARIEISDEGAGFDRGEVPDPTLEENLDKCSGRGLLLIEAYMSDVSWSEDGRTIRMLKHNSVEPPEVPNV